ncbi:MAG: hypothetical protein KF788_02680 [Piscinibacter sp.]|nr:hypothetical protein [Piscinibacter sp.]
MLRLSHEQVDIVERVLLRRHAALVAGALQETWPAVSERLKDRWGAFVEAALQQAADHGIDEVTDLARFASLWCIWGAGFVDKPGFEWAREVLDDTRRVPALKVHQLLHRTREELAHQQPATPGMPPVVTVAQFDAALARLAAQVPALGAARAVFLDVPAPPVVKACDLNSIDLLVAEAEGLQEYTLGSGVWQRAAAPRLGLPALQWTHAPDEPVSLAVPSNPLRGGPAARLNLRVQPLAVCDPRVHPEVMHDTPQGRLAWKGRDAARLSLALYANPPAPIDPKVGPNGIGAKSVPDDQQVQVVSCGLRDRGAPFGPTRIGLRVYPATQWLVEVRHGGFPALTWPNPPTGEAPGATGCKLQADGRVVEAAAWQRGWAALPGQFRAGLEKLFNGWARSVDAARMEVEASPLVGQAGLTWGYRRTAADAVEMRIAGQLDLLACALDLRLAGELSLGSARARVTLSCKGRSELRMAVEQVGDTAEEGKEIGAVKREWRFPFSVDVEPLAGGGIATLQALPTPEAMRGAIAGECGLRPRPDGQGLQWYFKLRSDPTTVVLACADPLLGTSRQQRVLIPALPLVDWSAG